MKEALKDLKKHIKLITQDIDTEEYIEFMREIGNWA